MNKIQYPTDGSAKYKCDYRGCNCELELEKRVVQDKTNELGLKLRCKNNFRHKYFVVVSVGRLIRIACSRWESPK